MTCKYQNIQSYLSSIMLKLWEMIHRVNSPLNLSLRKYLSKSGACAETLLLTMDAEKAEYRSLPNEQESEIKETPQQPITITSSKIINTSTKKCKLIFKLWDLILFLVAKLWTLTNHKGREAFKGVMRTIPRPLQLLSFEFQLSINKHLTNKQVEIKTNGPT